MSVKNKNKEKVRGKKLENIFLNTYFDEVFSDPSVVSTSLLPSRKVKYCNFQIIIRIFSSDWVELKSYITSSLLKNDGQYLDSKIPYTSSYALNNGGVDLKRTTLLMGPSKTEIQKEKK